MKISYGNAIYNHKPTMNDMVFRSGFLNKRKQPIPCPVREDTVEDYAFAYDNGICVKGYMFKTEKDIWKRTFVCDFDNLTEEQYKKVLELVENCGLKRIQGRMSSGMKVEFFQHEGIPDWKPPKWKYKVFFPLDEFYGNNGVMCVREEVERAYVDVVQFFNQWSERSKTEEIAQLWLKANNQSMYYKNGKKKGQLRNNRPALVIEDPMFSDYILPDPVEVTNPRHQITYSVVPEMNDECRFLEDRDWERLFKCGFVARFPTTTKARFCDIIDLPYDFKDSMEIQARKAGKVEAEPNPELPNMVEMQFTGESEESRNVPTAKSEMARKTGHGKWKDLVIDTKLAASTNRAIYSDWEHGYDMERVSSTMCELSRFLVRCQAECEREMNGKPSRESVISNVLHDIPWYSVHIFGETFFKEMDERKMKRLAHSVAHAIEKSCDNFNVWRLEQKCLKLVEQNTELLEQWKEARRELGRTADFETYYKEKSRLERMVVENAMKTMFPYTYVRRGLKKEMVEQALNQGTPMSRGMFTSFVMERISQEDGVVEKSKIEGWFRDYQSRFNKVQRMDLGNPEIYGQMTGYRLKNGKVRKLKVNFYLSINDTHTQPNKKLTHQYP